jgi:hypothetical protein
MTAVTFAEAGEWETARRYAPLRRKGRVREWIERNLLAAAFAEEGLHDEAMRLGEVTRTSPPLEEDALDALLRARGVRMFCGVLSPAALAARR